MIDSNFIVASIDELEKNPEETGLIVYDLDLVDRKYNDLKNAFPAGTLHGIAMKAAPFPLLIQRQKENGLGAEAASMEEVLIALESGMPAEKIIFDGPAKTKSEIEFCMDRGIYLNCDSFEELERIENLYQKRGRPQNFQAGLRVNPEIGEGTISHTSVAGKGSKFGVGLEGSRDLIIAAFQGFKWLKGLHVHIGSQAMKMEQLIEGTARVFELASSLNQIKFFDIGGGLPAKYLPTDIAYSFQEYTDRLKERIPELFSGKYQIMTEFGRALYASTAIAISRIEYVKDKTQIVAHFGGDLFLRRIYRPEDWNHQVEVYNREKVSLTGDKSYSIAGPLCFGGDYIHRDVKFGDVKEGDHLIIYDVGAYTLSMWSRHCSRYTPRVIGIGPEEKLTIKPRETLDKLMQFWS